MNEVMHDSKPSNQAGRGSRNVKFANLLTIQKSKNSFNTLTSGNSHKSMPSQENSIKIQNGKIVSKVRSSQSKIKKMHDKENEDRHFTSYKKNFDHVTPKVTIEFTSPSLRKSHHQS